MKRSEFMISDYPWLVKYFASRNPLHLMLFVFPVWMVSTSYILLSDKNLIQLISLLFLGIIYWSFIEYAIHRWVYHVEFKSKTLNYFLGSFHRYHHMEMGDRRVYNAGFIMVYTLIPILLLPLFFFSVDTDSIATIALGLSIGHFFYENVHFILHFKTHEEGYFNYIQKYHFFHHDHEPLKNFGNTSHLWDLILGTYDPAYKNYVMPLSSEDTLITTKRLNKNAILTGE